MTLDWMDVWPRWRSNTAAATQPEQLIDVRKRLAGVLLRITHTRATWCLFRHGPLVQAYYQWCSRRSVVLAYGAVSAYIEDHMHGLAVRSHLPRRVINDLLGFSPKATSKRCLANSICIARACCCVRHGCVN